MKGKLILIALAVLATVMPARAQQTVTVSGTTPYSGTATANYSGNASYSTQLILTGLPAGCVATANGNAITFTGGPCGNPITVSVGCSPSSVAVGKTSQCTATVINAPTTSVTWTSSDVTIATVSSAGLVTGVKIGSADITATSTSDTTKSGKLTMAVTAAATQVTRDATSPVPTSTQAVTVSATQDPPISGVGTNKLVMSIVHQIYDYTVNVPVAGSYTIAARLGTDATTTGGTLSVHFEMPIGTTIASMSLSGVNQWTTVPQSQTTSTNFVAGTQSVRFVVDSLNTAANAPAFMHYFQLNPSNATAQTHQVNLNWIASVVTDPASPQCANPQCPVPAGVTPCYSKPDKYNIYRSQTSGVYTGTPLGSSTTTSYIDPTVVAGQKYFYVARAFLSTSCVPESANSNEVAATVPTP